MRQKKQEIKRQKRLSKGDAPPEESESASSGAQAEIKQEQ